MLLTLSLGSHSTAPWPLLPISGSQGPTASLCCLHTLGTWKVRRVVHSWVHRELGFKVKLNIYSFHVGCKSIIRTGKCHLGTFISEWKSRSYSAALDWWAHVPLMQTTDWIYPMEFPHVWNAELSYFGRNWFTSHEFHLRKSCNFWFTVCSKVTAVFYIPRQSQQTI